MKHLAKKKKEKKCCLQVVFLRLLEQLVGTFQRLHLNLNAYFFSVVVAAVRYGAIYQKATVGIN